ncbi:MAG: four helix bundle protein [bacterium]
MAKDGKPYKKLFAWQAGYKFTIDTYRFTEDFPKHELYGVVSQLRRAAISVLANIVEGQAKPTTKDFLRYLYIAKASLAECEFFLELSKDLGYLNEETYSTLESSRGQTSFLLNRLIGSLTS